MIVYPSGKLEVTRSALDRMGFQKWEHPLAFPESRPVRIGSIDYGNTRYRIHAHVIAQGQAEITRQLTFRDRLRGNPELVREYETRKQEIIAQGITIGPEYANAKSAFIQRFSTPE
jgi:GrpB-like predicted nucleotidyltransferase (UPF0157 family)